MAAAVVVIKLGTNDSKGYQWNRQQYEKGLSGPNDKGAAKIAKAIADAICGENTRGNKGQ